MRRHFLLVAGLALAAAGAAPALAGIIGTLRDADTGTNTATVDFDRAFSVELLVHTTAGESIFSFEGSLVANLANAFEVTGYTYNAAIWDATATGFGTALDLINPMGTLSAPYALPEVGWAGYDSHGRFGSSTLDFLTGITGGPHLLVTIDLVAKPDLPNGTYSLSLDGMEAGEVGTFAPLGGSPGPVLTVVVPEPLALGLLAGGMLLVLRRPRC